MFNIGFRKKLFSGLEALPSGSCEVFAAACWFRVCLRCFCFIPSCVYPPCGEQGSCAPLLLDHADKVNCTSGGSGHMKCAVTCQRGFALQASSGQYLRPLQVSWKPWSLGPSSWGGEALIFVTLAGSGKDRCFSMT